MSSSSIHVVILAAGRGERMRAAFPGIPKSLVPLDHTPMLVRLLRTLQNTLLDVHAITIVVRPEEEDLFSRELRRYMSSHFMQKVMFCVQEEQMGYGTAAGLQAFASTTSAYHDDRYMVLNGDAPLVLAETLHKMMMVAPNADLVVGTVFMQDPSGYGRVVRMGGGSGIKILEQKEIDALPSNDPSRKVCEVNTGIYLMTKELVQKTQKIEECPVTKEKKLTDICGWTESAHVFSGFTEEETLNINSPLDRNYAEYILFQKRTEAIHRPLYALLAKDMRR